MADYAGNWQSNSVTVNANGSEKIGGVASAPVTLNTEGQSVTLIYVDSTQGWLNTMDSTSNVRGNAYMVASVSGACNTLTTAPCCANVKVATFLGPGTFTVCAAASAPSNNLVSYLVVGGGGGAGAYAGGGGGAGGYREVVSPSSPYTGSPLDGYATPGNRITVSTASPYPITVGGGGAVTNPGPARGCSGAASVFDTITGAGGGYGGASSASIGPITNGGPGGSGGGGAWDLPGTGASSVAGVGNTPSETPAQGFPGGTGRHQGPTHAISGGGGGSGAAGNSELPGGPPYGNGDGGAGVSTSITGASVARGGGGGACAPCGTGGTGGGGNKRVAGTINTGGGGGGGDNTTAAIGGSGIVIIRYKFQ